ncbi:hypothetical protein [Christiangramia echinicola]|uniref:hypothetical protein n=1 Tax=Christiangramia echinicola TaxID=279359 RepID=UPI001F0A6537|nr:hypothetical protein [Christiangramia echinicola]
MAIGTDWNKIPNWVNIVFLSNSSYICFMMYMNKFFADISIKIFKVDFAKLRSGY